MGNAHLLNTPCSLAPKVRKHFKVFSTHFFKRKYLTIKKNDMVRIFTFITLIIALTYFTSCTNSNPPDQPTMIQNIEVEKEEILNALNGETKAAFQRDYEAWTKFWIHDPNLSKTYMNYVDNSFSESIGWKEVSGFVKKFIEEHPTPEPPPKLLDEIDIRLYENGAWVSYEQLDSIRGRKRETRLMEKENGMWKIAGMHTTIYGFEEK